ncbi:L,D-transpeptidase family protein [Pelosinus sp. sgz500959]|uniref:L,D-transpeptidase family protein n=1 Tax=Pelosinus sp. sgz500959 TaxID=3242472 RepID=UPI00366BFEC6
MNLRMLYLPHPLSDVVIREDMEHPIVGKIQELLTKHHFYHAQINNKYDTSTSQAVTSFQEEQHLPATGIIDGVTYCRLQEATVSEITPLPAIKRADSTLPRANILISTSSLGLTLFNGNDPIRQYPIGIGKLSTPTPLGNYAIALKFMNPGGALGTRWLGLNYDSYGIHGTNQPWLIGTLVSHGCIRMHNSNVEELFSLVKVGTPVYIRN